VVLLFKLRVVITEKAHEQTTVVFYRRTHQARERVEVQAVAAGIIVLFVAWIIHHESIWGQGMLNDNAVHQVCLMLGQLDVTIFFVVKISQREEQNLGMLVMSNTVNKKERGCQPTRMLARDGIHHMRRIHNRVKPEGARHLLFGEVGMSHMNHHLPNNLTSPLAN
jgi:hypothetical protein